VRLKDSQSEAGISTQYITVPSENATPANVATYAFKFLSAGYYQINMSVTVDAGIGAYNQSMMLELWFSDYNTSTGVSTDNSVQCDFITTGYWHWYTFSKSFVWHVTASTVNLLYYFRFRIRYLTGATALRFESRRCGAFKISE
jgi:hypothetical protein